jgi:uncharacterized protein YjbI with pentapeptide repeats
MQPEPWEGDFESVYGVDRVESVTIDGTSVEAHDHGTVELLDCELSGATLTTGGSSRFDIVDSILTGCDLSRARIETVRGARLVDCKLAGTDLSQSTLRDACFERCSLSYTNLRMSTLERVAFESCRFEDTDFYSSALQDVSIAGSTLQSVIIDAARFQRVDLRDAAALDLVGIGDLVGCLLTDVQAHQLAIHLALQAGASVERDV